MLCVSDASVGLKMKSKIVGGPSVNIFMNDGESFENTMILTGN